MLLRMRYGWAELVLKVLDVEGVGQFCELAGGVVLVWVSGGIVHGKIKVEVVEVDKAPEVLVGGSAHGVELLCARPC